MATLQSTVMRPAAGAVTLRNYGLLLQHRPALTVLPVMQGVQSLRTATGCTTRHKHATAA